MDGTYVGYDDLELSTHPSRHAILFYEKETRDIPVHK